MEVATTRNPKAAEGERLSFHEFPALRLCEMRASGNALSGSKKLQSERRNRPFRMPIYIEGFFSAPRLVPALRALGIAVEGLLMSAKHAAKESAAWTKEFGVILLEGIEDNRQGKQDAQERVKALHPLPQGKHRYPRDFEKWLTKVFEKPSEDGVPPWLTLEFWQQEVDKVLIQGIFTRNVTQDEVVQRVHSVWPKLSILVAWRPHGGSRTDRAPPLDGPGVLDDRGRSDSAQWYPQCRPM